MIYTKATNEIVLIRGGNISSGTAIINKPSDGTKCTVQIKELIADGGIPEIHQAIIDTYDPDDLRRIVFEGKKNNQCAYKALKSKDFIRSTEEFF